MKRAFGIVLAVTLILGLLVLGTSCESGPKLPDTSTMHKFQTSVRNGIYCDGIVRSGDGYYISGSTSNNTNNVLDYKIEVITMSPQLGYGSNSQSEYQKTVGSIMVRHVQPGESRTWRCKIIQNGVFVYLDVRTEIVRPSIEDKSWEEFLAASHN